MNSSYAIYNETKTRILTQAETSMTKKSNLKLLRNTFTKLDKLAVMQ